MKAEHLIVVDTADVAEHFGQPWPPSEPGFCLLLCEDAGERFTLTFGLEYTKRFADAVEGGVIDDDTELPIHMFRDRSEGWPPAVMSARCPACQEVMLLVDGCTAGGLMNAYRYGEEPHWQKDDRALLPRCRDCGARLGHHHHVHCLNAWCAQCDEQAVGCEHNVDL